MADLYIELQRPAAKLSPFVTVPYPKVTAGALGFQNMFIKTRQQEKDQIPDVWRLHMGAFEYACTSDAGNRRMFIHKKKVLKGENKTATGIANMAFPYSVYFGTANFGADEDYYWELLSDGLARTLSDTVMGNAASNGYIDVGSMYILSYPDALAFITSGNHVGDTLEGWLEFEYMNRKLGLPYE